MSDMLNFNGTLLTFVGWIIVIDTETRYGLNSLGIESRWGARPALGPTQPPVQLVPGLSWR